MKSLLIPGVSVALFVVAGCKHKVVAKAPAMAPPAAAATPTAQISASPSAVTSGDKVVLTWDSTNASHATISGLGTGSTSGSQTVTPSSSTTYTLTATGPAGSADATASVTGNGSAAGGSSARQYNQRRRAVPAERAPHLLRL